MALPRTWRRRLGGAHHRASLDGSRGCTTGRGQGSVCWWAEAVPADVASSGRPSPAVSFALLWLFVVSLPTRPALGYAAVQVVPLFGAASCSGPSIPRQDLRAGLDVLKAGLGPSGTKSQHWTRYDEASLQVDWDLRLGRALCY